MSKLIKRDRDEAVIKADFILYLSREMLFNNPPGHNINRYRKHHKCQKVRYSSKVLSILNRMEDLEGSKYQCSGGKDRAVAIKLGEIVRYVWRSDVLTEAEYDQRVKQDRRKLSSLRKKHQRNVGSI